jgi:hypothetical protein
MHILRYMIQISRIASNPERAMTSPHRARIPDDF